MYRTTKLGLLVRTDPVKARLQIRMMLGVCDGHMEKTAEKLEIGIRSLYRYMRLLEVREAAPTVSHQSDP